MPESLAQIKATLAARETELADLKVKYRKLEEAFAQLQTSHTEYENKLASAGIRIKKEYIYKDDECRPVPIHGACEKCGWNRDTQMRPGDKNREPHPLA
jgi:hypothetical protein